MKEYKPIITLNKTIELLDKLDDEGKIEENIYFDLRDELDDIRGCLERVLWHIEGFCYKEEEK